MKENKQEREKQAGGEIVVQNKFVKWVDNFWYHYKWHVIAIAFFVLVGVVCFVQCSSSVTGDLTVSFSGNYTLNQEERSNIVDVLEAVSPKRSDGSGRMSVIINDYSVYTEDELRALYIDENGDFSSFAYNNAKQINSDHLKTFGNFVMTGESAVWLVSEYVYTYQNLQKLAVPLSEIFETVPASAYNEYAIRLGDTEWYRYYDVLKVLPADTLIVMPMQNAIWGESSNEESYATFMEFFRNIVEFKAP